MTKKYVVAVILMIIMVNSSIFVNAEEPKRPKLLSATAVDDMVGREEIFR